MWVDYKESWGIRVDDGLSLYNATNQQRNVLELGFGAQMAHSTYPIRPKQNKNGKRF